MVESLLSSTGNSVQEIVNQAQHRMSSQEAVERVGGKLPETVAAMLRTVGVANASTTSNTQQLRSSAVSSDGLQEDSMQKARRILNGMVAKSNKDLDDVLIECQEFKNSNRMTFDSIETDLASLASALANMEGRITAKQQCVTDQDTAYTQLKE